MNSAFEYTLKAGGLMKEQDYPYAGIDRNTCNFDKSKIAASIANFSVVNSIDEDQIAANLVKNGPLASNYKIFHIPYSLLFYSNTNLISLLQNYLQCMQLLSMLCLCKHI